MTVTGSPDITNLDAQVTWDISGVNPVINLINQSFGPGLSNCTWWIVATSPTNTPIHEGSLTQPDASGAWTSITLTDSWPRPFQQIEWSGAPYIVTLFVQDSVLNTYSVSFSGLICRPFGNTSLSKTPYGLAKTAVQVMCNEAGIFFQDQTVGAYKGITGTLLSSVLRVIFPIDPTYTIPAPMVVNNFSSALIPITYNSKNYQFVAYSTYSYQLGDNSYVIIKYQQIETFAVLCNVDFAPLVCEIVKLDNSVQDGSCVDAADARRRLNLIYPKLMLAFMGQLQPLTGVPVARLIDEIVEIGGFTCDCNVVSGIIPATSSVVGGYIFDIVTECGDISGNVTTVGNTVQFNLSDVKYVFAIYPGSVPDTSAFSISPVVNGCTKTYYLNVDLTQLSEDILNTIKNNANLVNLFNSIVAGSGSGGELIVDGGCIFSSTSTCDFVFGLANIPANTTYAILTGIKIGSTNHSLSYSFNQTNLGGLQAYLNGLGLGAFTVSYLGASNVEITSTANPNDIQSLTYKISATSYTATQSRDCTGFVPIDANEVVQNIINYICDLADNQIFTSQDYLVCYLDNTGAAVQTTIAAGTSLSDFFAAITETNCLTLSHIQGVAGVTCSSLQALFTVNTSLITANDFVFITKGGGICSRGSFLDVFNYMLQAGISNATTKNLFCQFVVNCGQGLTCDPYNYVELIISTYNTSCVPVVGIGYMIT